MSNKLLNNLLGMYKQAKLNKKAESYKSKVAELLNDINEPSPIMDYISESEAEGICKAIGIPHEASWYKGDLLGYIDEVPDGMVDVLIEHISEEDAESLWRRIAHDMGMDVDAKKQTKMSKKAEEKESAKKDYTEQYAKVKEIMKEYGYGLSDGGYIYLISKEQPKDEGFQVKFKGDRLRVELDGKLKYSGYGPEAIEDFLKGMFYAKKLSSKNTKLTKKAEDKEFYKEYKEEIKSRLDKDNRIDSYVFSDDNRKVNIRIKDSKMGYRKTGFISLVQALDIEYLMDKVNADGKEMKTASKAKAVRKQAIRTFDQAIKDDLLKGNKTWEDAGKDIRDSGWSSFSLDKEGTIEMLKLTEEEIAKIDSLQQTAKEKKQIAEEYTKQYYAGKFDLETLHDKLVKIFGNVGTAFEWLRDNDEKIKRSSSTKKQAEKLIRANYQLSYDFDFQVDVLRGEGIENIDEIQIQENAAKCVRWFISEGYKKYFSKIQGCYYTVKDRRHVYEGSVWLTKEQLETFVNSSYIEKDGQELELVERIYSPVAKDIQFELKIFVIENIKHFEFASVEYPIGTMIKLKDGRTAKVKFVYNNEDIQIEIIPDGVFNPRVENKKETIKVDDIDEKLAKRQNKLSKSATIKHENGVYNVYSESGKCLGKGYKTKEEAEKRLKQVEYFKNKKANKEDTYEEWGVSGDDIDEWSENYTKAKIFFEKNKKDVKQFIHKVYDISGDEPEEIQVDVLYDRDRNINKLTMRTSLKQVEYFTNKKAATGYDFYGPKKMPETDEGTFRIQYYGGPGKIDYLRKSRNGKYHWVEQTHFDYINDKPFETTDYELAKKLVEQYGGEIEKKESKQVNNKRTSLKQVVISKMAKIKK